MSREDVSERYIKKQATDNFDDINMHHPNPSFKKKQAH
jgi:hypothetical protein